MPVTMLLPKWIQPFLKELANTANAVPRAAPSQ